LRPIRRPRAHARARVRTAGNAFSAHSKNVGAKLMNGETITCLFVCLCVACARGWADGRMRCRVRMRVHPFPVGVCAFASVRGDRVVSGARTSAKNSSTASAAIIGATGRYLRVHAIAHHLGWCRRQMPTCRAVMGAGRHRSGTTGALKAWGAHHSRTFRRFSLRFTSAADGYATSDRCPSARGPTYRECARARSCVRALVRVPMRARARAICDRAGRQLQAVACMRRCGGTPAGHAGALNATARVATARRAAGACASCGKARPAVPPCGR
jgi:hypothetical protein